MKRSLLRNLFNDDFKIRDKCFQSFENQVELVEKFIPHLTNRVSEYSRKKVDEKKCLDKIVTLLSQYSVSEKGSLHFSIDEFSQILNQMSQHLDEFLVDFDDNVVQDLAEFKTRCKHLKVGLKTAVDSAEKVIIRQRQLQRLEQLTDQERKRISAAEAELLKSKAESVKATKNLQQNADIFQQKKLMGLRASLLAWTRLELQYHARALELFTDAYQAISAIDVVADLEEFRNEMPARLSPPRLMTVQQTVGLHIDMDGVSNRWSDPPTDRHRSNSRQSGLSSTRTTDSSRSK